MPISLPKVETPTYKLKIPSTNEVVEYRPYLVSEEKVLMIALESSDNEQILTAVKKIVKSCTFDKVDLESISSFDLEYIFIKLRSKSVGEIVNLVGKCQHCQAKNDIELNLEEVEVVWPEKKVSEKIMITDKIGVIMKYPKVSDAMINVDGKLSEIDEGFHLISKCIKNIFDDDNVYPIEDYKTEEVLEFIESLNHKQLEKITTFLESIPEVKGKIKFKCISCGKDNEREVSGIQNFFT